jgi:hypothetical protein
MQTGKKAAARSAVRRNFPSPSFPKQLKHSQNPLRFPLPPIYNPKFKSRVAGKQ